MEDPDMVGIYKRTTEVREKQRQKMLVAVKSYDFDEITKKRKRAHVLNGTKSGRKKGCEGNKTGWYQKCKICSNQLYVIPSAKNRLYCSRACQRSDPDYRDKLKKIDRSYMQTEMYAQSRGIKDVPAFLRYKRKVHRLTEETYVFYNQLINPDGYSRTLAGTDGGYHLDHIISIKHGFLNSIPPEEIAKLENLQMLPWKDNIVKGSKPLSYSQKSAGKTCSQPAMNGQKLSLAKIQ